MHREDNAIPTSYPSRDDRPSTSLDFSRVRRGRALIAEHIWSTQASAAPAPWSPTFLN